MKDIIQTWKNSEKYQEFQFKLFEQKKRVLNHKERILNLEMIDIVSEKTLRGTIETIKQLHNMILDSSFEYNHNYFSIFHTETDILLEYLNKQKVWFGYLFKYIKLENFELCAEIRDAINLEFDLILQLLIDLRPELFADEEYVHRFYLVMTMFYEEINNNL